MCGRYDLDATVEELAERFGVPIRGLSVRVTAGVAAAVSARVEGTLSAAWKPRYNIAPTQQNPVLVRDGNGQNRLQMMQWGLVPAWAKEPKVAYATINARAETVASKPTFRKPLVGQRCLVPATGYFEWVEGAAQEGPGPKGKQPYRIQLRGMGGVDGILAFAGLYDIWRGPDGEELQTYTIVTTRANSSLSAIHSRMPVILPMELEEVWLDGNNRDIEQLIALLQPYPEEGMTAYPVSRLVNSPRNDARELIAPWLARAA